MERYNHLNDFLFLKFMGEKGDEKQCLSFLNAVLGSKSGRPANLVKILENKTFTAEVMGGKTSILDVRVETDAGERVNIEVQLRDEKNMERRTLYHWGREYVEGIESGVKYNELPRVITINIVNFDMIKLEDYHTCFHLREDEHREYVLTDVMEIHIINMVKFRKNKTGDVENDNLERWLTFFDEKTPDDKLEEVIRMDSSIEMAYERIKHVTQDKELLRAYHMREMGMMDWRSSMSDARREGREEGKIDDARNMLNEGLSLDIIHRITGLDTKTIQSL
jgi:predicted transposase/invertase (TIGR01784 family)